MEIPRPEEITSNELNTEHLENDFFPWKMLGEEQQHHSPLVRSSEHREDKDSCLPNSCLYGFLGGLWAPAAAVTHTALLSSYHSRGLFLFFKFTFAHS